MGLTKQKVRQSYARMMPERISMSDRILVVKKASKGELVGEQITEQEIIRRALGVNRMTLENDLLKSREFC